MDCEGTIGARLLLCYLAVTGSLAGFSTPFSFVSSYGLHFSILCNGRYRA
jgi:hypothetical protein